MLRIILFLFFLTSSFQLSAQGLDPDVVCPAKKEIIDLIECEHLINFANQVFVDKEFKKPYWKNDSIERWNGVTIENKKVVRILVNFASLGPNPTCNIRNGFPHSITKLSNLRDLRLWDCAINDAFPEAIYDMTQLDTLLLHNTGLTGTLSAKIKQLTNLTGFNCRGCKLYGPIPKELFTLPKIDFINLSNNRLSGTIPSSIYQASKLEELYLGNNSFSGKLPKNIGNLKKLYTLDLQSNDFYDELDAEFIEEIAHAGVLRNLSLSNNRLYGDIPHSLFQVASLEWVQLSNNQLTGTLPDELVEGSRLNSFSASQNKLHGRIPKSLLEKKEMRVIDLSSNNFSSIPNFEHSETILWELLLNNNKIRSSIPSGIGTLSKLEKLDLSGNHFTGEIPKTFNNLKEIYYLDLSNNQLTGSYPLHLHELGSLGTLDIRYNLFSGNLPEDIEPYIPLNIFLSHNHFTGTIPQNLLDRVGRFNFIFSNNHLDYSDEEIDVLEERNYKMLIKPQWPLPNQTSQFADIQLPSHPSLSFVQGPIQSGLGSQILIIPSETIDFSNIHGCSGTLDSFIYRIPESASACTIRVDPQACTDDSCGLIHRNINGVPDSKIENPSRHKLHAGVMHLRGWVPKLESRENMVDWTRKHSLKIDNQKQHVSTGVSRQDVVDAMKTDSSIITGWDLLVNMGNLENGAHTAELIAEPGYVYHQVDFNSFAPRDRNGNYLYIREQGSAIYVDDFPIEGHRTELKFDVAGQNFTISDQLNSQGLSQRSTVKHFSEDSTSIQDFQLIDHRNSENNVDISAPIFRTEKPGSNSLVSGVVSFRGWAPVRDIYRRFIDYEIDLNSKILLSVSTSDRPDVREALRKQKAFETTGWSRFFYSGQLKNGIHRFRFWRNSFAGFKYLTYESIFESFTPVDNNGNQFYITNNDTRLTVVDFPFIGSEIDIQFNQAGQNFSMIAQRIDGKTVQ